MELRAYFFQNMYLQGIHAGIQSQHCTVEMFLKYPKPEQWDYPEPTDSKTKNLYEWANDWKTTIVLNGGGSSDLKNLVGMLSDKENKYPWAYFRESNMALNGALTNVGIILPSMVFDFPTTRPPKYQEWFKRKYPITDWEIKLASLLNEASLMR